MCGHGLCGFAVILRPVAIAVLLLGGCNSMAELPDSVTEQIKALSAEGDELAGTEQYADALVKYWAAWELLPEPKTDHGAATWILAAIGDANFLSKDYAAGRDNLSQAMHCPDAIGNPFLHLRLGQCSLELGQLDVAADELARAYMSEGEALFEQDDPKYLTFVKTRLKPPAKVAPPKPWWKVW